MKKIINIPINQDILKLIAILTMTIDHLGYIFTPSYEMPLRFIGRISFPIFAFLLAYNLTQKDLFKKYITRLTSFAVSTSLILIPFKYQIGNVLPLNIFWTLLLGVITIYIIEITNKKFKQNNAKYIIIGYILCFSALLSSITDYEFFGFLYILSLYSWYKTKHTAFGISTLIISFVMNLHLSVWASIISCLTSFIFLLPLTKPAKTIRFLKPWWLFYAYYPVHLAILYAVKIYY
jgi:hypothetical protein